MNRLDAGGKHRGITADSSGILLFSAENGLKPCYNCGQYQYVKDEFRYPRNSGIFRAEQRNFLAEQRNLAAEQPNLGAWDSAGVPQRKAPLVNSGNRDTLPGIDSVPSLQRSLDALVWLTLMADLVWLWVVYRVDSDAVFGAIRRAEKLYRTAEEARSAVGQIADRMGAGELRWEQTDEATWVARTTRYVCVAWSIRLPE